MKEDTVKRIFDLFNTPVNNPELIESESDIDQLYALCDDPMQCPVKLIDEQLRFTDLARIQDLFVENTGFLVVGAIGLQGCGKSSLLNVLANQLTNKTTPLDGPFRVQTIENFTTNSPQTGGIDLYITQDRVILLDVQPLMSFALTNYHVRAASSLSSSGQMDITPAASNNGTTSSALSGPGNWSLDVWAEMTSLQIIAFLLNCCHVILVVSDEISNTPLQLHRLVDRASGLKPTMYTPAVIPQVFQRCQQSRVQTETATVTTECNQLAGRQGYTSSAVDASKDPILTEGRVGTCMKAAGTTTGAYTANTSQTDEEEGETEDVDDADGGGSIDISPERHRTTHNASDEPNVTVAPSGLLQSHRTSTAIKRENAHQDVESTDVTAALNRLQSLTDYSASLIHVYNQAPSAAFLNPIVRSKLHAYQYQLLPMLYPETRRLAAMVTLGSRILSSHSIKTRYRNRSVEKTFATTVPTENQPRDTTSGVAEASSEASAFGESNHIVANQALGSTVVVDSGGGNKNDDIDHAHSEVPSGCSVSSVEPSASNHLLSDDHGQDERNMQVNRQDELGPQQTKLSNSSDVEEIAEANSAVNAGQKSKDDAQTGRFETELLPVGGVTSGPTESDSPPIGTASQSSVLFNLDKKPISVSQIAEKFTESSKQIPGPSTQQTNRSGITSGNLGDTRAPSEAELVAELDTVIHEVEHDVTELLKHPLSSLSTKHGQSDHSPIDSPHSSDASDSDPGASQVTDHLDGERLNARLARLTQQIQSVRRQFFDVQQRLNHPRLFLIPEVDSDGHPPTGCPSYASSVRVLQEAIMSTPRQHMMLQFTERKWIAYAQKMWEAVCSSPLLADYHAILTNRV